MMSIPIKTDLPLKAAVSVAGMCRLLKMSRSQFYFHVKRGTFHAPLYLAANKRPYFTATMAEDNLRVRETGVGANNEYVIFYERLATASKCKDKRAKPDISSLIQGLKKLPLEDFTLEQVEQAIVFCFPSGTGGHDEDSVLRAVFRHLKRSGSG